MVNLMLTIIFDVIVLLHNQLYAFMNLVRTKPVLVVITIK